jgi:hypothetical protein
MQISCARPQAVDLTGPPLGSTGTPTPFRLSGGELGRDTAPKSGLSSRSGRPPWIRRFVYGSGSAVEQGSTSPLWRVTGPSAC